ncbi:MAG: PKD domain-containing protein [Planctomycetota bacterium]|nr:PKD domain-containing protein [Planctomycetota bacterium]
MTGSRLPLGVWRVNWLYPLASATFVAMVACAGVSCKGTRTTDAGTSGGQSEAAVPEGAIYVDGQLDVASSTTYAPASRKGSGGRNTAYKTIRAAASVAVAGQTVVIRAGTYQESLVPSNSGTDGKPITFRSAPGEAAVITGPKLVPAINISGRSFLVLEGLCVADVGHWMYALKAHHNIIRACEFRRALLPGGSAKTGLFFQEATFNRIVGNTIEECGSDSLALIRSDRNLVEKNTGRKAKHTRWVRQGGNFNIIRDNYFHNEWQKIGEIYDCEDVGFDHEFNMVDCTKHNLVEGNVFARTASSGNHSPFAGIQYAGQKGIIRRNVFYETIGPAFDMTLYSQEAKFNTGNRVYNNVFCRTDFAGICLAGTPSAGYAFSDNILQNNILVRSAFIANDTRWAWYTKTLAGKPVQVMVGNPGGFVFEHNNLVNKQKGEPFLITVGGRNSNSNPPPQSVEAWQAQYPKVFRDNLEQEPMFVDEAKHDFHLKADSPMIDAGAFLTTAVGSGNGMALPVKDAGYFCDGFGIPGVEGDWIQLESQSQKARVTGIDYEKNVLRLDQALTWKEGQGVSLAYSGKAPDLGALEFMAEGKQPPIASFSALPQANSPFTVDLDASGSRCDGTIGRYEWDFGDGNKASGDKPQTNHIYAKPGEYQVVLKVIEKGPGGLAASATRPVSVGQPILTVDKTELDFGLLGTSALCVLRNSGTGTMSFAVSSSEPWLTVDPPRGTCTTQPVSLTVTANRAGLKIFKYRATLVVDGGAGGSQKIRASMVVPSLSTKELVRVGDEWRYLKGTMAPPANWNAIDCDDQAWLKGPTGIGYSTDISYPTKLDDMKGKYISFYARRKFSLTRLSELAELTLTASYDDGFIAYINGVEVARSRSMGPPGSAVTFKSEAPSSHDEEAPAEKFSIAIKPGLLKEGENVLAIEVHNVDLTASDDAGIIPRLDATFAKDGI